MDTCTITSRIESHPGAGEPTMHDTDLAPTAAPRRRINKKSGNCRKPAAVITLILTIHSAGAGCFRGTSETPTSPVVNPASAAFQKAQAEHDAMIAARRAEEAHARLRLRGKLVDNP